MLYSFIQVISYLAMVATSGKKAQKKASLEDQVEIYINFLFQIFNRLWRQIPSWSLMAMPRPPGTTTLLVLANSSESTSTDRFPSPNHTSWSRFIFFRVNSLGVTSSLTSLRSQGSPNNKKLSAAITSSIKCFSRQFLNLR